MYKEKKRDEKPIIKTGGFLLFYALYNNIFYNISS